MQVGDRLICVFIDPPELGSRFTNWPLHITIIPWFRVGVLTIELTEDIQKKLRTYPSFNAIIAGDAHFGHQRKKLVSLIQLPSPLVAIESKLRQMLRSHNAWLVDETTKTAFAYRPHVTTQGSKHLSRNDICSINTVLIVEQKGEYKEIISGVTLKHE